MKTVLCYGDSNTYGYNPENGMRYHVGIRWTSVLQNLLGNSYNIIEEGCNGRTTIYDDPIEGWKNGLDYLKPCLNSHKPVDIVIMMLGSNDLKTCFNASSGDIADGAGVLVKTIINFTKEKQGFTPVIILVSPPSIGPDINHSPFSFAFNSTAIERSKEFPKEFERVSKENDCIFFDAASYVSVSSLDSLHLTAESHRLLAEELCKVILHNAL